MDAGAVVCGSGEVKAEVLVIGGGLAGSAAAITLARGGRDVVLVEREAAAQHKVCGEFLSREALGYLRGLGVHVGALGGVPISMVRLGGVEVRLPFEAMSLTRRVLDEALLQVAVEAGVRLVRGCSVEGVEDLHAVLAGGEEIDAGAVFLATGKHDLRGRPRPAGKQGGLVAFKMYWRLAPEQAAKLNGCVELVLYRGGYGGLQPVEEGVANLCCLIEREELRRLGGGWERMMAAMVAQSAVLRERLEGAEAMLERPLAISAIPYGFVRERADGVWALGDQAAVIPSFTGDGMSIALHTGVLAARMFAEGKSAEEFQRRVSAEMSRQVGLATFISQGLVARPGLLSAAARVWPGALRRIAMGTRIPEKAMLV